MLCIETMHYADEVVARDKLIPGDDVELTERERAMARQLVETLAVDEFEPEKFHDEYREQVLELIEHKTAGEEIVSEPVVEPPAQGARPRGRARSVTRQGRHCQGSPPDRSDEKGNGQEARGQEDDRQEEERQPLCRRAAAGGYPGPLHARDSGELPPLRFGRRIIRRFAVAVTPVREAARMGRNVDHH